MVRIIIKSGIWGLSSRLFVSLSQIAFIPLLIDLFGKGNFGFLMTLISLNAFLSLSSFGVSKSMQNKISMVERSDNHPQTLSLLYACMVFVAKKSLAVFFTIFLVYVFLFSEPSADRILLVLLFLCGGFFTLQLNILLDFHRGCQRPDLANKIMLVVNLLTALLTGLLIWLKVSIEVFFCTVYVILPFVAFAYQTANVKVLSHGRVLSKNEVIFDSEARDFLLLTAIQFFAFGFGIFMVSTMLGTEYAADYNIVFRFYSLVLFGFTVFTSSSWPFITKLHSNRQVDEITKLLKKSIIFLIVYMFFSLLFMNWIAPIIVFEAMGIEDFNSKGLYSAMSLQLVVVLMTSILIPALNALNILRVQIAFGLLNVLSSVFLSVFFLDKFGVSGSPYAIGLSNLFFGVIPLACVLIKRLRNYESIYK